jgi:hypothetical protein
MWKKLVVAIAALTLAGCVKVNSAPPTNLPDYVQVYPGATQVMSMEVMGMSALAFRTSAAPDDVIAYYRTQASAAGLPEQTSATQPSGDQRQAAFGDPTSGRFLAVAARPQNGQTLVSLTYKAPPKTAS